MEQQSPLRRYRTARGLTLEGLATILAVHKSTVKRWEDGSIAIPAERAGVIESITGISRRDLRPDLYPQEPEQAA